MKITKLGLLIMAILSLNLANPKKAEALGENFSLSAKLSATTPLTDAFGNTDHFDLNSRVQITHENQLTENTTLETNLVHLNSFRFRTNTSPLHEEWWPVFGANHGITVDVGMRNKLTTQINTLFVAGLGLSQAEVGRPPSGLTASSDFELFNPASLYIGLQGKAGLEFNPNDNLNFFAGAQLRTSLFAREQPLTNFTEPALKVGANFEHEIADWFTLIASATHTERFLLTQGAFVGNYGVTTAELAAHRGLTDNITAIAGIGAKFTRNNFLARPSGISAGIGIKFEF